MIRNGFWGRTARFHTKGTITPIQALFPVGDGRECMDRGIAEPVTRGRNLAPVHLADLGDELLDAWDTRLLPVPLELQKPTRASGGIASSDSSSCCNPAI